MPASAKVLVGEREVTVRELTVAEVRDWAKTIELGIRDIDPAGDALFDDITLGDIAMMSDAERAFLIEQFPSDLRPIADICKKVNPHFFRLRAVYQAAHLAQIRAILSGSNVETSN